MTKEEIEESKVVKLCYDHLDKFNIVTKDHFYHNGGNIENRRTVVEALVCNFDTDQIEQHNHGLIKKTKIEQLEIDWT